MKPMTHVPEDNGTTIMQFILLGFRDLPKLHGLLFLLFLVIYLATVAGNLLIIALVLADQHLHTPMYFFLGNLSFLETCYSSTILPRLLASLLTGDRTISVAGCIAQLYVFGSLAGTECCLLSVMSYDRYLAICQPLHYAVLMNDQLCLQLVAGLWIGGFVSVSVFVFMMSQLTFCGPNTIDHFFCDFRPIIKLSCTDTHMVEVASFISSSIFTLPPFLLTLASYVYIGVLTILQIPSTSGRQKAFSTCSSHLIVVSIFYGTLIMVYLVSESDALRDLNKVFSVFYGVLTPLVNPLIYSLRNKEVKEALRKVLLQFFLSLNKYRNLHT